MIMMTTVMMSWWQWSTPTVVCGGNGQWMKMVSNDNMINKDHDQWWQRWWDWLMMIMRVGNEEAARRSVEKECPTQWCGKQRSCSPAVVFQQSMVGTSKPQSWHAVYVQVCASAPSKHNLVTLRYKINESSVKDHIWIHVLDLSSPSPLSATSVAWWLYQCAAPAVWTSCVAAW